VAHFLAREQDHGDVIGRPRDLGAQREPVHARQVDVQQEDGRLPEPQHLKCLLRRAGFANVELVGRERGAEQRPQRRVVVDDEHSRP
jgi:hypothetical protein